MMKKLTTKMRLTQLMRMRKMTTMDMKLWT